MVHRPPGVLRLVGRRPERRYYLHQLAPQQPDLDWWNADVRDEFDRILVQNFPFLNAELTLSELRPIVERTLAKLPSDRRACWFASNHDHSRMATRWAHGNAGKHKAAIFLLLTLPGAAVLYQGDEIGLEDGVVPGDRLLDLASPSRD